MAAQGLMRPEAAALVGLRDAALREALRKPHVAALLQGLKEDFRTQAGWRGVTQIAAASIAAASEAVRLDAAKTIAALAGHTPVARSEVTTQHVGQAPGLSLVFNMGSGAPGQLIEGMAVEVQGTPHPALAHRLASNK